MSPAILEVAKEEIAEALKTGNPEKAKRAFELLEEAIEKRLKEIELERLKPVESKVEKQQEKIAEVEVSLRDLIEITRNELRMGFEAMNARFEALQREMDKRFEALQREMDARFEAVEKRISFLQWIVILLIGIPSWGMIFIKLFELLGKAGG